MGRGWLWVLPGELPWRRHLCLNRHPRGRAHSASRCGCTPGHNASKQTGPAHNEQRHAKFWLNIILHFNLNDFFTATNRRSKNEGKYSTRNKRTGARSRFNTVRRESNLNDVHVSMLPDFAGMSTYFQCYLQVKNNCFVLQWKVFQMKNAHGRKSCRSKQCPLIWHKKENWRPS